MSINFSGLTVVVDETATIDDAELLLEWLQQQPDGSVDLHACSYLHAACLQALMAGRARITRFPADATLAGWLKHALNPLQKDSISP